MDSEARRIELLMTHLLQIKRSRVVPEGHILLIDLCPVVGGDVYMYMYVRVFMYVCVCVCVCVCV